MNTDVTNAPLVLPERLCVVEVGQGFSVQRHPPWKRNPTALQRGGFLLVSTGGSIFVSANAFRLYEEFLPGIPEGVSGWGAKGQLDLNRVRALAPKK